MNVWFSLFIYLSIWAVLHGIFLLIQKTIVREHHHFHFKPLRLNWKTTLFNQHLNDLTHKHTSLVFWQWWFRFGTTIALCTTFIGTWIVIRSSFELGEILYTYRSLLFFSGNAIEKRNFRILFRKKQSSLLPMIPGLTLPFNHAHYYFFALFICTLFHELGHGLCASVYDLSIQYIGIFINYIYPGAFISISQSELDNTSRWIRLQVACAGIWHNLILYSMCKLFTWINEFIWICLGWKNIEKDGGVSVVSIHQYSPLYTHIKPGSRIFQLNDVPIGNGHKDWKVFWNSDFTCSLDKGFCSLMNQNDTTCCDFAGDLPFGNSTDPMVSCFQNIKFGDEQVLEGKCLYTLQILASNDTLRCRLDTDCYGNSTCVVPVTPSIYGQRVRIFSETRSGEKIITIYEGALKDVLDSVQVSNLHPTSNILPIQLPHQINLLISYVATFSLALALLNGVPAFNFDGVSIYRKLFNMQKKLFIITTKLMTGLVYFVIIGSVLVLFLQTL